MHRFRIHSFVAVMSLVGFGGSAVHADSVTARLDSLSPRQKVTVSLDGNSFDVLAGLFHWTNTDTNKAFNSFCIDLEHHVQLGSTYTFDRLSLTDARGDEPQYTGGRLSSAQADLLELFWGQYFSLINSKATAAAFQLGVWEIVYDGLDSPYSGGLFDATANGAWTQYTASWLNGLDLQGARQNLVGLHKDNVQDQIVAVPTPTAAVLGGIGLVGFVARRRTR